MSENALGTVAVPLEDPAGGPDVQGLLAVHDEIAVVAPEQDRAVEAVCAALHGPVLTSATSDMLGGAGENSVALSLTTRRNSTAPALRSFADAS